MARSRADVLFERFRESGDPRALGQVFDLTATELFKVAAHLCGDRHGAEDLLQSTFLTAIEDAQSFEPGRAVLPWLLGILANRSRMTRRADGRREERERRQSPASGDPVVEAETRELRESLDRALRELTEPYRHVLFLHLEHGLSAREIAEALARPAGTVRTQIVRGMELLRNALPVGLAGAVVVAAPAQVLLPVRVAVLESLGGVAPAAWSSSLVVGGLLLMKKSVVGLTVLLLAGIGVLVQLTVFAPPEAASADLVASSAPAKRPLGRQPGRDGDLAPADQAGRRTEVVASRTSGSRVTIRGRAVDADGRALAGVAAAVTGLAKHEEFDQFVIAHGPVSFVEPASQTTGGDGRFSVAFVAPPPFWVTLSLRAETRVPVQISWSSLAEGTVADVGDVRLVTGCQVSGRVVDADGRARGGARLMAHESRSTESKLPPGAAGGEVLAHGEEAFMAGADGGFVLEHRVGAGMLEFAPEDGTQVTPMTVPIGEGVPQLHVVLAVVDLPDDRCIRGRIVDESGRGIAAALVRARRQELIAIAGDDGRFTLVQEENQDAEPTDVVATKHGYEPASAVDPVPFGERDVLIVLRAGVACQILVREGASGRPVERFGVRIRPVASEGFEGSATRLLHAGVHPGGRLEVPALARGPHEVTVEADPAMFPPSPLQRFDVVAGMGPVIVDLFPLVDFEVVVRHDGGAPVVGSVAELLEMPAEVHGAAAGARPLESRLVVPRAQLGRVFGSPAYCVAKASCGEDGVARMKAPRGAAFVLRVSGDHAPIVVRDVDTSLGRQEVWVPRGASVVGRVLPPWVVQAEVTHDGCGLVRTLQLRSADGGRRFPTVLAAVDGAGDFQIVDVPAGDWVLEAQVVMLSPGELRFAMLPVAVVDGLTGGETRRLVVDVGRLRPATLRARIVLNGRPAVGRLVKASVRVPSVRGETVTMFGGASRVGDDGVAALVMVPGQVTVAVALEDGGDLRVGRELRCAEVCELVAGDVVERTFSVRSAGLRARVIDVAGAGVQGVRLVVRAGEEVVVSGATDADGRVGIGELVLREWVMGVLPRVVAERFARGEVVELRGVEDVRVGSVVVVDGMDEVVVRMVKGAGY